MKQIVGVKYMNVLLNLEGYYSKGDDRIDYYPDLSGYDGSPSEFDTHSVFVNGVDIINILSDDTLEELDNLAVENIES
jgi:hypothetical protein